MKIHLIRRKVKTPEYSLLSPVWMKSNDFMKGILFTAAGGIGWAVSGVCSQYLFLEYNMNAAWLTAVRMILSGVVLLGILLPKMQLNVFSIFKKRTDQMYLIAFALLGLLLCQYTFMGAIKYSNSATATVLQSLNVVIMAVLMVMRKRSGMSGTQIAATVLAVLGTYLIATNGNLSNMALSLPGLILGILSAVGVVTYTLLSGPIIQRWGNLLVTGWGMLIGGSALGVIVQVWNVPHNLDLNAFIMIAVIVFVGTAGGFSAFLQGVKYIGPVKATIIGCIEPAAATVLSALCLSATFGVMELIGFLCILSTVLLSVNKRQQQVSVS